MKITKTSVVKIPHAMYGAYPFMDKFRPAQHTPFGNFFVAGDWTKHDINACMEGAVVSGKLAANHILSKEGLRETNLLYVTDEIQIRIIRRTIKILDSFIHLRLPK
jgi:15-cis-phytoene desaturase